MTTKTHLNEKYENMMNAIQNYLMNKGWRWNDNDNLLRLLKQDIHMELTKCRIPPQDHKKYFSFNFDDLKIVINGQPAIYLEKTIAHNNLQKRIQKDIQSIFNAFTFNNIEYWFKDAEEYDLMMNIYRKISLPSSVIYTAKKDNNEKVVIMDGIVAAVKTNKNQEKDCSVMTKDCFVMTNDKNLSVDAKRFFEAMCLFYNL